MTFVDTNAFMYAVGDPHPLQMAAQDFFEQSYINGVQLYTSAEVLQELAHAYLRVDRGETFDSAMELVQRYGIDVLPLEREDVLLAPPASRAASPIIRPRPLPPRRLPASRR